MGNAKFQTPAPKTDSAAATQVQGEQYLPTFLDHVHELRRRLFWIVGIVLVASSVAYSFIGAILDILTAPLGEQGLFYLTPGGGLSFSFKLCAYVGLLVAVPLIMYHLYRFMEPLMVTWRRSALFYVGLSTILAVSGVLFAYFVSLPAAIKFLTGFNVSHVQAMLTADSYLSFVATYLLGAALLFQIPLLLLIINTMTPLKPSKLMKLQKFVIVGAFILAAMISPTPDVMNQAFLAIPIIGMYQLGVILVWIQNGMRARKEARLELQASARHYAAEQPVRHAPQTQAVPAFVMEDLMKQQAKTASSARIRQQAAPRPLQPVKQAQPSPGQAARQSPARLATAGAQAARTFNDIAPRRAQPLSRPSRLTIASPRLTARPARPAPRLAVPSRSVDGFSAYRTVNVSGIS